ncbi:neuronal PAS domain-containing protein 2-like isoform X1 [Bradysia coprophila]|uniref:neuronal PAS domain-containing protein 2-like isoform X1 n=1 Tax=Bradysia coprophila TaxID=38358 RepID=UPI00187DB1A2|nr:neuronal PAS domain-containing protein 2-like isoform X1 [Bradysia coprophila]XP_037034498.1 neuronal PAS domain-containing protein 2-like isoform X1 [Bradysia coprophila]XP_037034499.1 neuronal PAS domain-containing protein 2-like isoform X1 [Bradysia coprophila]
MSTSDYTYSPLYNNNGNAPHNAAINHPSTSTFHTNYYSSSYYPPYNQQLPHTNVNNNFVINNNNIDERDTSSLYSLQSNQTQQYQQPQPFRVDTYNGGVGSEGYRVPSTATNWFKSDKSTEQQSNVMNIISMASSNNGREARNKAEKNRRDKLNNSIQELSTMVPHVAESPRRVDKTAVLRFSAHGMRVEYVFGRSRVSCVTDQLTDALVRLLDTFFLTVTCKGQIVLVSPSIEQHLGHCQTDLFGQNITNFTHPDDHAFLQRQLIPTDLENLFDIPADANVNNEPKPRSQEEEDEIDRKLRTDKRRFTIRLARAGPRTEPTQYEVVQFDGCFRRADSAPRGVKASTFRSGMHLIRRARCREDTSMPLQVISGNDVVLVAMARVIKPPTITERLFEANKFEYKTRHLIDGRIVQCDQRISIVAGYMADEVSGLSPFTFMHKDDVRWVMVALRQMYDYGSTYGESCYRLMARTGQFIYLKTRGYLDIDRDTNEVRSFVCHNTLITEDEGRKLIREMKKKFAVIIQREGDYRPIECDEPAVENPVQLERAILSLITNLHSSSAVESADENVPSPTNTYNSDDVGAECRNTKSPGLAYIAPKVETIKVSIDKSVKIIETSSKTSNKCNANVSRPSVLHKVENTKLPPTIIQRSSQQTITGTNKFSNPLPNAQFTIKEEPVDSRVPPLPTAVGYFESNSDLSSPPECKISDYGNQSIYSPSSTTGSIMSEYGNERCTSVLKRTHDFDNNFDDPTAKRRIQYPGGMNQMMSPLGCYSQYEEMPMSTNQSIMQNYQMADAAYMGDINTNFDRTFCAESSSQYSMGIGMTTHNDGRVHPQFVNVKQELTTTYFDTSQLNQSPNSSTDERDDSYDEPR